MSGWIVSLSCINTWSTIKLRLQIYLLHQINTSVMNIMLVLCILNLYLYISSHLATIVQVVPSLKSNGSMWECSHICYYCLKSIWYFLTIFCNLNYLISKHCIYNKNVIFKKIYQSIILTSFILNNPIMKEFTKLIIQVK